MPCLGRGRESATGGLAAAIGAVALLAILMSGCESPEQQHDSSCESTEHAEYEELEETASRTLADVQHTLSRYSRCEDAGVPGAAVIADVETWSSRREVNDYLASLNWTKQRGSITFVSPDGAYNAQPVMSKEPSGPRHVAIYFSTD